MSVDYSKLSKAQLIAALETMQEWARQRVRDEQQRPTFEQSLARIVDELRNLNSRQDQFYREVLDVLTAAKDGDVSLRSGQPEAAPDGQEGDELRVYRVCGKPDVLVVCTERDGPLTREQWVKHHDALYYESGEYGASKVNAAYWADSQMENRFGPCPEEES